MNSNKDPVAYSSCHINRDLAILLIGSTGAGKSATGNSILGEKCFVSRPSSRTVTLKCEKKECDWNGRHLTVVDTPGFLNSNRTEEEIKSDVGRCLELCTPGHHAIVLVLQTGRFTKEEQDAAQRVENLFGNDVLKHMVVVFTRKEDLRDKSIQTFVKEAESELKKLITKCGNRYCAFNNRATGQENNKQVSELIKIIDEIHSTGPYDSPILKVLRKVMNKGMAIGAAIGAGLGLLVGTAVAVGIGWQYSFLVVLIPVLLGFLGGGVWYLCIEH